MTNLQSYSELKQVIEFCKDNSIDFKQVISEIQSETDDFCVDNYRFISESEIDEIQCDELEADSYILGCFNADFISDNTDLSYDIVKALQEAEKYESIGQHIIDNDYISAMQKEYSRLDGYGHHFSGYDSETLEDLLFCGYYAFRVN